MHFIDGMLDILASLLALQDLNWFQFKSPPPHLQLKNKLC